MTPHRATLLIEILTEELPPRALLKLATTFTETVQSELIKLGLLDEKTSASHFATPRRLAISIPDVLNAQTEQLIERRGPAIANGLVNNEPTQALLGFARSCGVPYTELAQGHDGKQTIFIYHSKKSGESLETLLPSLIEMALKKLPAPKMMRWGEGSCQFIRPIHNIMLLHGSSAINAKIWERETTNLTLGHRFLSQGPIIIDHADHYEQILFEEGKIIASFEKRRERISEALDQQATMYNAELAPAPDLLDEVTALVEWPAVYSAQFDPAFLNVPQECLILSMQQHQRYFALLDQTGKLLPQFLLVSNIETPDPTKIITGNERVLRARLEDAQFFYTQDKKHSLATRVPLLTDVVYHHQLGSQLARVQRLEIITQAIAQQLNANVTLAGRAAYLAKADLLTDMVGEFPELQGIMGKYYAQYDKEDETVLDAIAAHYQPRFANDTLPQNPIAQSLALADKLESIVGIYGIGLIPTGDKDPFALRRAAVGIARLLLILPLNLKALLTITFDSFAQYKLNATAIEDIYHFITERLKNYLSQQYTPSHIEAALARTEGRFDHLVDKLAALRQFNTLSFAPNLIGANKRILNILKKNAQHLPALDISYFIEPAEKALFEALSTLTPKIEMAIANRDYTETLTALTALDQPIDHFFNSVMVMSDEPKIRENRLTLLHTLANLMNQVADLSMLAE